MICFLTSRTDSPGSDHMNLNPANGFVEKLRRCLPEPCRALDICSNPKGQMDYQNFPTHERKTAWSKSKP